LTHDAAGLFTFFLFLVGVGQAALFVWQLRLIRKSLGPAEEAARAATANAQAMIDNERPWIGVDTVYTEKLEPGPVIQQAFVRIKNTGKTPALRMRKRPHQTQVCCRWDRSRGVFIPHEQGNDAD
jgi:hypothetical protein